MTGKDILRYLNPIRWFRALFSNILTFFLLLNQFFAIIFGCIVVIFIAWFFYDRYSNYTYGDGADNTHYKVKVFQKAEQYKSPLMQGNAELSKKLKALYLAKINAEEAERERQKEEQKAKQKAQQEAQQEIQQEEQELLKKQAEEQEQRASLNPNAAIIQRSQTNYQEERATRPYRSIQSEVQHRLVGKRK